MVVSNFVLAVIAYRTPESTNPGQGEHQTLHPNAHLG